MPTSVPHVYNKCNTLQRQGQTHTHTHTHTHSLRVGGLLGEDPEDEVCLLVGVVGRGHDDVLPRGQTAARAHLPQVDEELGAGAGPMRQEEVSLQVHAGATPILETRRGQRSKVRLPWLPLTLRI